VGTARIVQAAIAPEERSNPPLSRDLALGATLGLLAGFGLALLAETRDNTIKSSADVEGATGLPVLAAIPDAGSNYKGELARATRDEPEGVYADGYQKLRAAIEFATMNKKLKSVLITSPNPEEGKSTTASNLAIALSTVGKRTILLDLDFRRGRIHGIYGIPSQPGLSDHILHDAKLATVAPRVEGAEQLFVIPTGTTPPNPAAFVGTPRFLSTVEWMEGQAETVVLDAPPLFAVSDTYTLAKNVDAVVLTARVGKTTKSELQEVLSVLGQVDANVVGVVLVGVKKGSGAYNYYNYGSAGTQRRSGRAPRAAMPRVARPVPHRPEPQYVPPYDAGEVWVRYHDTGQIEQIQDGRYRPATPVPPPERDAGAGRG
jgi:capsular exopolysaccharide synthesis family protein